MTLKMTVEEIKKALGDTLDGYAENFRFIAEHGGYVYFIAEAGGLAEEEEGIKLDYQVGRRSSLYTDGMAYYTVMYRTHTGWEDNPFGSWRWATDITEVR